MGMKVYTGYPIPNHKNGNMGLPLYPNFAYKKLGHGWVSVTMLARSKKDGVG